jgi:hypothetical protein
MRNQFKDSQCGGKHEIVIDLSLAETVSIGDDFTASQSPFESVIYRFRVKLQ